MNSKARNFVFTAYASPDEDIPRLILECDLPKFVTYIVYQMEMCPETNRVHLQGYLECLGQQTYRRLQDEIPGLESAHFEVRRGNAKEAIAYCKKEDSRIDGPWEIGIPKQQGARSDLEEIKEKINDMISLKRIHDENFSTFIRYGRALKEYKRQVTKPRDFLTTVILLVGPSGVGKSRFATALCKMLGYDEPYKLPKPKGSGTYWDDYDGQTVTFIDEFDGNYMRPTDFNELADRYEYVVPVHGGAGHQFVSKYLVICSNYLPKYWWKKRSANQLFQTTRRIHVLIPLLRTGVPKVNMLSMKDGVLISHSKNFII